MWLNLLGMGVKTAAKLYQDKQKTKEALSGAKLLHAEKMRRGEIEFSGKVFEHQKGDWKDEFVLIVLSTPIFMLAYSVFTDDPEIERKMDLFFEKLQSMPWWVVGLWVSVGAAIYGIKDSEIKNLSKGPARNRLHNSTRVNAIYYHNKHDSRARVQFDLKKPKHLRIPKKTSIGRRPKMSSMNKHKKRTLKKKNRGCN